MHGVDVPPLGIFTNAEHTLRDPAYYSNNLRHKLPVFLKSMVTVIQAAYKVYPQAIV